MTPTEHRPMMRPPGVCPVSSCGGQIATPTTSHHAGDPCEDVIGDGDDDDGDGYNGHW